MKSIILTVNQWQQVRTELQTEYPKTVFMLRDKMKRVLGFTVREHKEWVPKMDGGYSDYQIHLDFYSENKRTMFLLKFSEVIGKQDGTR
jgi:hypothetical protein